MLLFLFLITVIVYRYETSKEQIKKKTDYYKSSQTKEKTKWNQLNKIKENKDSYKLSFKPT